MAPAAWGTPSTAEETGVPGVGTRPGCFLMSCSQEGALRWGPRGDWTAGVRAPVRVQRRRRSTGAQWSEASWAGLKRPSGPSGANTRIVVSAVVFNVQAGSAWLPA